MRENINKEEVTRLAEKTTHLMASTYANLQVCAGKIDDDDFASHALKELDEFDDTFKALLRQLFTAEEITRFMRNGMLKSIKELLAQIEKEVESDE